MVLSKPTSIILPNKQTMILPSKLISVPIDEFSSQASLEKLLGEEDVVNVVNSRLVKVQRIMSVACSATNGTSMSQAVPQPPDSETIMGEVAGRL